MIAPHGMSTAELAQLLGAIRAVRFQAEDRIGEPYDGVLSATLDALLAAELDAADALRRRIFS